MKDIDRFKSRFFIKQSNNISDVLNGLSDYDIKRHQEGKIVLMQCTGLKDKNGVLIFEGDLLNNYNSDNQLIGIYEIYYNELMANYWVVMRKEYNKLGTQYNINYSVAKFDCKFFEVIGNIYDNKKLLEE